MENNKTKLEIIKKNKERNIEYPNLVRTNQMTEEEAKKISRKGGVRSGQVRSEKAKNRKMLENILEMTVKDPKLIRKAMKTGRITDPDKLTYRFLINLMAIHNALDKFAFYKDIVDRTDGTLNQEENNKTIKVELSPEIKEWSN